MRKKERKDGLWLIGWLNIVVVVVRDDDDINEESFVERGMK